MFVRRLNLLLALAFAAVAFSQTPHAEIGVEFGGIRETVLGEYPVAGGGRFTIHAFRFIDAEAEVNRIPIGGAVALFPATQFLAGARVGRRFGRLGIYGKVRPGVMRFDANLYAPNLHSRPALDAGGVLEFYSSRHLAFRMDFGNTVVWYGRDVSIPAISAPGPGVVPGIRHQLQWSMGLSVWL